MTDDLVRTADISRVVSLGSTCMTSELLKRMGLKTESYPFDWIFSSPDMVSHCLEDDFRTFLDPAQYRVDPREAGKRCFHTFYNRMIDRPSPVFNHRDPMRCPEDYDYLVRCVDRMRAALADPNPTLYVLFEPTPNRQDFFTDFHRVWRALGDRSRLLHILFEQESVVLPRVEPRLRYENATLLSLYTTGPVGRLGFEADIDNAAATVLIKDAMMRAGLAMAGPVQ